MRGGLSTTMARPIGKNIVRRTVPRLYELVKPRLGELSSGQSSVYGIHLRYRSAAICMLGKSAAYMRQFDCDTTMVAR